MFNRFSLGVKFWAWMVVMVAHGSVSVLHATELHTYTCSKMLNDMFVLPQVFKKDQGSPFSILRSLTCNLSGSFNCRSPAWHVGDLLGTQEEAGGFGGLLLLVHRGTGNNVCGNP